MVEQLGEEVSEAQPRRRWLPRWRPRNVGRLFPRAVASFRPLGEMDHYASVRLERAERRGLQLAILCRTVGFGVAGLFYVISFLLSGGVPTVEGIVLLGVATALGVGHFIIIGTRYDRSWLKFVALTIDIFAICAIFAFVPLGAPGEIPQVLAYRGFNIHIIFPFLALAALSFSPRLVLWAGAVGVVGWWGVFVVVTWNMDTMVSWTSLPSDATFEEYVAVVLSPDFVGRGSRMAETLAYFITASILALAVARARYIFVAQVHAEEARERERNARMRIIQQFGRFVPPSIAKRLIENPAGLDPQVRHGAVLVMDMRDFTASAEGRDPRDVIAALNIFLAQCADAVSSRDGVVITFTGDGLLATFNTPLEVEAPEARALDAARALVACAEENGLFVRVGLAAGKVAAGSVGSAERQAFTVYGDTVNRAARLETLAKDLDDAILADRAMREADPAAMTSCGFHTLRGFSEPVEVFRVATDR
ncbi:MAG: adenylate/guanylate cyclase domain-containing protein [Pseudomonadota bacterium]